MASREKTIAFVLYPGMAPLDLSGTAYPLGFLRGQGWVIVPVSATMEPVSTDTPLKICPQRTFAELPAPYGLIVPGGLGGQDALLNGPVIGYIRQAGDGAEVVASVGEGSLLLAKAGLLEGRRAATHWTAAKALEALGAIPVRQRTVEDGKFFTAAGVTAGIDLALFMVARFAGESQARFAQLWAEYDPHPPLGGIDRNDSGLAALKTRFTQESAAR